MRRAASRLRGHLATWRSYVSDHPSTLTLFVTNRCNARCRMCLTWKMMADPARRELSLDELARIATGFDDLDTLILTGGEPLLRGDLADVIGAFHCEAGTRNVVLHTNLYVIDAAERILDIAGRFPGVSLRVQMSLDGVGPDHDAIRGTPGGFDRIMESYEVLRVAARQLPNLALDAAIVVSAFNAHAIREILDFVATMELADVKLVFVRGDTREPEAKNVDPAVYEEYLRHAEGIVVGMNRGKPLPARVFSAVSLVAKDIIADNLLGRERALRCNAGRKFLVVNDVGDVMPCVTLGCTMGNLREVGYDISRILGSERARECLETIARTDCSCPVYCNIMSNTITTPALYPRVLQKCVKLFF